MVAYLGVTKFFGRPLWEVATELNYADDLVCILKDEIEVVKKSYPTTYNSILSCEYKKDARQSFEYAKDLIASWLVEDYFAKYLSYYDLSVKLDGSDQERKILPNSKVSNSADYMITHNNNTRKVELMNDYSSFWKNYETLHLRDLKYDELVRENALLIAIALNENNFRIFDFSKKINATFIPNHKNYGNKPAYSIHIPNFDMKDLSIYTLSDELKLYL